MVYIFMNLPIHLPFATKTNSNVDNYIMVTITCMDHGSVKACDILVSSIPDPQIFAALPLLFFLRKGYALQVESFCCFLLRFLSAFLLQKLTKLPGFS